MSADDVLRDWDRNRADATDALVALVRGLIPNAEDKAVASDAIYARVRGLEAALRDCGTNETNPDTCGVCGLHFEECLEDERAVGDCAVGSDVPAGREPACPGARARGLVA